MQANCLPARFKYQILKLCCKVYFLVLTSHPMGIACRHYWINGFTSYLTGFSFDLVVKMQVSVTRKGHSQRPTQGTARKRHTTTARTTLTHLWQMDFPTIINWTNLFRILGFWGSMYQFPSNYESTFCKQTVETLIRRRVSRRLTWVCTVWLCPTKWTYFPQKGR